MLKKVFLCIHETLSDLLWTARSNMKRAIDALLSCQTQSEHRSCSRHQSNQFHPRELWVFAQHRGTVSLPARPMCKGNRSPVSGKKNAPHTPNYEEEPVKRSLVVRSLVTIASPQGNLQFTKKSFCQQKISKSPLPLNAPQVFCGNPEVQTTVKLYPLHKFMDHLAGVSAHVV